MQLRPIDRTDRNRGRLNAALGIYRETILPEAQNPERQILYWIEHSNDELADEFRCFALQRGSAVVGYLQYTYFREEHIFFFEYLCVRDSKRKGLVPSEALKCIEDYLAQNYRPGFTIVFEIARKRNAQLQWEVDGKLIIYFKRLTFRTVNFDYRYPILQSYDGELSYPADLMVRLPDGRTAITSSELRTILRCVYFRHYLRWDRPFLQPDRFAEREHLINKLYSSQIVGTEGSGTFGTSGDDSRSRLPLFRSRQVPVSALLEKIFGPKLPRLVIVIALLLVAERVLGSIWLLVPFVPVVAAIYCLVDNSESSRKLLVLIMQRFRVVPPRSS
jgi:hypothetical protein